MKIDKSVNMQLWRAVEKTNPKYTKEVGFGRKFTSINAQYQMRTATEQLGPIGDGWGISNETFTMICEGLIGYQAIFWYKIGEERCEYCINSSINTHSKAGKLDDECYKKVSTDALTKGLSKLGFNADIFLGKWDDNKYVNQVKEDFNTSKDKPAPIIDKNGDFTGNIAKPVKTILIPKPIPKVKKAPPIDVWSPKVLSSMIEYIDTCPLDDIAKRVGVVNRRIACYDIPGKDLNKINDAIINLSSSK
jgi:hypothetical protein